MSTASRYTGLIEHYRDRLPVTAATRVISLGEGNTPLIRLENIPRELGKVVELYVKYEGLNPTGSFKDRGMTMAVTRAVEEGSRAIICASTGNTSAAAAAYAARAGITGGDEHAAELLDAITEGAKCRRPVESGMVEDHHLAATGIDAGDGALEGHRAFQPRSVADAVQRGRVGTRANSPCRRAERQVVDHQQRP